MADSFHTKIIIHFQDIENILPTYVAITIYARVGNVPGQCVKP